MIVTTADSSSGTPGDNSRHFYGDEIQKTVVFFFFIRTMMFSNPKQVFIVPKPNCSTAV